MTCTYRGERKCEQENEDCPEVRVIEQTRCGQNGTEKCLDHPEDDSVTVKSYSRLNSKSKNIACL